MSGARRRPARRRAAGGDPARSAAFAVLRAVEEQGAYTNLVLPSVLRGRGLGGRDAAFVTELVSGTVRGRGSYDAVLGAVLDRPPDRLDPAVLDALRMGAHQLLAMRVPAHAAVATTVDLVRAEVGHGPAGLVNAVLRKVAAHDLPGWVRRVAPDPARDPVGFAAVAYSHPRWVVELLSAALHPGSSALDRGRAADRSQPDPDLDRLLEADNAPPKVTLVARPGLASVTELVSAGGTPTRWSPYGVQLTAGDPGDVPAVVEGRAGVQDEGSQLVALALARASVPGADTRWLDLCAGPGGKAALLAALAGQRGARLLAAERAPHRSRLVASATAAVGEGLLGVVTADGTKPAWASSRFDRVLLDAPCTGLGALRRRPEARWRRRPDDVEDLARLQRRLLDAAADSARPGGAVAYVTCSPVLAETSGVVAAALAERSDVRLEDATALLPGVPDTAGPLPGTVQLWPHVHGTDAMFLALLRKV